MAGTQMQLEDCRLSRHLSWFAPVADFGYRAGRPVRSVHHQSPTRGLVLCRTNMLPSRRSTMVLRRLYPTAGPVAPIHDVAHILPTHFPALSITGVIFRRESYAGL